MVFSLQETPDGKVWICPLENKKATIGYLQPNSKGTYDWICTPFFRIPSMYLRAFYIESSGIAWIGGSEGVYRYDMSQDTKNYTQSFQCLIRKVSIATDSILYGGNFTTNSPQATLDYAYNDLKFQFAAPFFDNEEQTLYSFQLEGFDKGWSEWSRQSDKEYTNLSEGNYIFKVKAKNVYGVVGEEASYQLTILPPYYRTWWAYFSYVISAILMIYVIVKWNMQRLTLEKIKLEKIVKERTLEVVAQAEAIKEQNKNIKQLSEIGKELTASLNLEHILSTLYTYINEMMDATVFGIGLYQAQQGLIDYQMAIEKGIRYQPYTRDMKDKNQFAVWCVENRKEVFLNDIETEYSHYLDHAENKKDDSQLENGAEIEYPQALIYVPLLIKDEIMGVITIQSFQKNSYTQQDLNQLQNIANYASIALENAAQQTQITLVNDELSQFNEELRQQQEELVVLNENLEVQKKTLEQTYQQLKLTGEQLAKSIQYASHIQEVVMPELSELHAYFSSVFIIFKPKDVVSGDFYWFSKINDNIGIFALADCTGHGVPGAFMSMLACTLLHEIVSVKKIYDNPARILNNLHAALQKILRQTDGKNNDGMDISICCFEKMENGLIKLIFSGAKSRMCYITENQLHIIKGDRQYLGGKEPLQRDFTNHELILPLTTQFYLFSDGLADQNDAERKSIGTKKVETIIFENANLSFSEQKDKLEQLLLQHQGNEPQRDDISFVGLRL
jgi:serine phosphatase RsbU (regulator of sigma subunit)